MAVYAVRRVGFGVVTFWAATLVAFVLFHVVPRGAPPSRGTHPGQTGPAPAEPSIAVQYGHFARDLLLHGSLGAAFNRRGVTDLVLRVAPITASVAVGGALMWLAIGLPLGLLAALRPRSLIDRGSHLLALVAYCAHPIWLGLMLSYFVAYRLHVVPIQGYCDAFYRAEAASCGGVGDWAYHLALPWFVFALFFAALYARMTRASVLEEMAQEYVRTARAKGAPERRVVVRHVLRNALLPLVTMLGMDFAIALGGATYVEVVFGLPGLGLHAWQSIQTEDYAVLQGIVIFTSICVIAFNLLVDLVYAAVDPRVRLN